MKSEVLCSTTGTIGTPACMAMWKAPFLNGCSGRVGLRVPSGAIMIEMPSRQRVDRRLHGRDGLRAIRAVDEDRTGGLEHLADEALLFTSFLAMPVKS